MTQRTRLRRPRRRSPGCLIVIAVLAGLLGKLVWAGVADYRNRHQAIADVRLADGDRLTLSFEDITIRRLVFGPGGDGSVLHWLTWRHGREVKRYLVAWNRERPPAIELRADATQGRLWLVCEGEVFASLDRGTEWFINRGGWVVEPSLSPDRQRNGYACFLNDYDLGDGGQTEPERQPAWAESTAYMLLERTEPQAHHPAWMETTGMAPEDDGACTGYGG